MNQPPNQPTNHKAPTEIRLSRKLWDLIPNAQRRELPVLGVLVFIGMGLEVIGIGLLVPLINLLTRDNVSADSSILSPIFNFFGATTQIQMLIVGFGSIGVVVLIKNVYLVFGTYFQSRFTSQVWASLEDRLFGRYLRVDYGFHLRSNSATLLRNLTSEIDQVALSVLIPVFSMVVEIAAVIGISALLFYAEPIGSLALVIFFAICGVTYTKIIGPLLSRYGNQRAELRGEFIKNITETLGGIKQVKVLGRESFFQNRFAKTSHKVARVDVLAGTLQRMPAYLVELWGVLGLIVVVGAMLSQNDDPKTVVSALGLFVGASFRFVPSLNRILIATNQLKYVRPAIDLVHRETVGIGDKHEIAKSKIHLANSLEFRDVSFAYESGTTNVLQGATFTIKSGESLGIIGPSGVGKSTLVDILLGLLTPGSGQVIVDGNPVDLATASWQSEAGYVPQDIFLIDDTIRRNIAFGIGDKEISEAQIFKSIEVAQLARFISTLPQGLDTITGERGVRLSGGQRQRIGIARALYHEPSLLVLDEATSALDLDTESEFIEALEAVHHRLTMVVVSHRISTLKYCDRVLRIEGGILTEVR
jgi:ABC-type multidrug transport system fused ATPase/permease subunit